MYVGFSPHFYQNQRRQTAAFMFATGFALIRKKSQAFLSLFFKDKDIYKTVVMEI